MSPPDVVNDFEAWAAVSAKLIGKSDSEQQELLSAMDLSLVWKNANHAWSKAIASDIVDMRLQRAQRYAEICAEVFDANRPDPLSLSLSDDLSRQTTHRMRAHPSIDDVASLLDSMTPTTVSPGGDGK